MAENSGAEPKRKRQPGPGRPFRPGQSGNPGGRPRGVAEFKEMAKKSCPDAIKLAGQLVRVGLQMLSLRKQIKNTAPADLTVEQVSALDFDYRSALAAAVFIRDTGMGKPAQAIEVTGKDGGPVEYYDLKRLTDEQLEAVESTLAAVATTH